MESTKAIGQRLAEEKKSDIETAIDISESPSYSFNLKIAFSLAATLAELALLIAGIILSNPIVTVGGCILGIIGFGSLCFFFL